jgi:selenocysteine-specific elongation factor
MHVIATAGHVDHGKSTLVRALTGMEPDRWAEERRRGMTIDLGFAWTTLDGGEVIAFVDVPGHERFVPTMVAGVGPVPAVLFVVAADEGWQQQSTEHLAAIDAFEVAHGLLVVTRADLADPAPAMGEALRRLADTSLADVDAVTVSAHTGQGLDELRAGLANLVADLTPGDLEQDLRLWVDRSFTITGAGTVVTGTLTGASIAVGDTLEVASTGRRVRVRGVQCLGQSVTTAEPVSRVALNLRGIDHSDLSRGDALVSPGVWLHTTEVDVRLHHRPSERVDEAPQVAKAVAAHMHLTLHVGTAAVPARARRLGGSIYRVRLASALPLRIGDRGLLREPSNHEILLGVTVLDPQPPPLRRRGAAARRAATLTEPAGNHGDEAAAEIRRRGVVSREHLRRLGVRGDLPAPIVGDWLLDAGLAEALRVRLVEVVHRHAVEHPLEPGLSMGAAASALDLPDPALVAALISPGLDVSGGRITAADSDPGLPAELAASVQALRDRLADAPLDAPNAAELSELGLGHREIAAAVRAGALLRLAEGVVLLPDAPARACERLVRLPQPFTVSEAKQAWQTSRRVAVPLLELLDDAGITQRLADGRRRLAGTGDV